MDKKYTSIQLFTRIKPIEKINDEFALCKVYVQGIGKNRNYSYMSKENVLAALSTLSYVPVVGHLMPKYDDNGNVIGHYFGGHDYEITSDWKLKSLTVPFGVVVEDSFDFETVEEFGVTVEYLTCSVILWTSRYPELADAIYSEDVWFNESMEINVTEYRPLEEDSNYTELLGWSYSALCLLGLSDNPDEHCEPCFISSKVVPEDYDFNKAEFSQVMAELKDRLSFYFDKTSKEGGSTAMTEEIRIAILAEFGVTVDVLDFEITEELSEDDFRAKVKEFVETQNPKGDEPKEPELFSMTYNQKRDAIRNALEGSVEKDADGNITKEVSYWVSDFDDEYVYVERDTWIPGDFNCDNGRFKYSFNEDALTAEITSDFEIMFLTWLTAEEKQKLEDSHKLFEELIAFKDERLKQDHTNAVDEVLSEFEDILESEEFSALSEHIYEIENLEEIKNKCYAIRGKMVQIKFEKKDTKKTPKVPLAETAKVDKYGGLFDMYSKK